MSVRPDTLLRPQVISGPYCILDKKLETKDSQVTHFFPTINSIRITFDLFLALKASYAMALSALGERQTFEVACTVGFYFLLSAPVIAWK